MKKIIALSSLILFFSSTLWAGDMATSALKIKPLLVGSTIPDAKLKDQNNKNIELKNMLKGKASLLVFYRGGWCPYCNRHLQALAQSKDALDKLGIQIIAISPDSADKLTKSMKDVKIDYTLLSDSKLDAAKNFGVAFNSGRRQLPVPSVFLFNSEGVLTFQYVNPNYKVRLDQKILMAAAKVAVQ